MRGWFLAALAAVGGLLPGVAGGQAGDPPNYKLSVKSTDANAKADTVIAVPDKDGVLIRVVRQRGIGSAEVTLVEGQWPAKIRVVFEDFKMMEHFAVTTGKVRLATSLNMAPKVTVAEQQPDGKFVEVNKATKQQLPLSAKDGRVTADLPGVLTPELKTFQLHWIDAYRN